MGNAPGAPMPGLRWLTGSVQGKLLAYFLPLVMISTIVVFGFFEWNARRSAEAQLQAKLAVERHVVDKDFADLAAGGFQGQWCGRHSGFPFFFCVLRELTGQSRLM